MHEGNDILLSMEAGLIGAALSHPEAIAALSSRLQPEHFLSQVHGSFFGAMVERQGKGLPTDPRSLAAHFHADWKAPLEGTGGLTVGQYVAQIMGDAAPAMQIAAYAEDIRNEWALRMTAEAVAKAGSNGNSGERLASLFSAVDDVRASLVEADGTAQPAGEAGEALLERVNDRMQGKAVSIGATTGFPSLDTLMGGYIPGQLIIVAGRPGMGKSTFATSSAWQCADHGHGVQFFSLEMGQDDMSARLLADMTFAPGAAIHHSSIKSAGLNPDQFRRLCEANHALKALPLEMDFAGRLSVSQIGIRIGRARKRLAQRGYPLSVVFVDYLKMVAATDRYRGNRVQEVGEITAGLREVAKREGVCIVLLAQLNRGVEGGEDKRPELHHLRDSGDIEADADAVLFAFRPAYYLETKAKAGDLSALDELDRQRNVMEVIAAKNRNGPTRTEPLYVDIAASAVRPQGGRREVRP